MFEIYKKGQGATARWITAAGLGGMAAFGAYELYDFLDGYHLRPLVVGSSEVALGLAISIIVFIGSALLIAWVINLPRFVDYLIMSEIELRKVSWPTKDELKRQTTVVIITLVAFSLVLFIADLIFAQGSKWLYKL